MVDDIDLWNQFRAGDPQAFDKLIQSYYRTLFNYGTKFSQDPDFVKDCLQDLFVDLWRNRATLNATGHIRFYLLKAFRRKIIYTRQRPIYRLTERLHFERYECEQELSVQDTVINEETTREQIRRLNELIERLGPRQREAVYLRYFQNMEFDEVASIMNVNVQSVRNLLHQAIKLLRQQMVAALLPFFLVLNEEKLSI